MALRYKPLMSARAPTPSNESPLILRYRMAWAVWLFMACWLAMLGVMTYIFVRDGGFHQDGVPDLLVMMVFWLFGIGGAGWAFSQRGVRVEITRGEVRIDEYVLWWRTRTLARPDAVHVPTLRHDRDSDGDDTYRCVLRLRDRHGATREVTVAQSNDRDEAQATRERVLAALPVGADRAD